MRNLHSIAQTPAPDGAFLGVDFASLRADPIAFAEHVEGRFLNTTFTDTITANDLYRVRDEMRDPWMRRRRTEDQHRLAMDVMRRIDRAAMGMRYSGLSPRDFDGICFEITRDEWYALRMEMPPGEFERNFGPEGTQPTFRGMRLRFAEEYDIRFRTAPMVAQRLPYDR